MWAQLPHLIWIKPCQNLTHLKPENPITQHTEIGRRTAVRYKTSGGQVHAV